MEIIFLTPVLEILQTWNTFFFCIKYSGVTCIRRRVTVLFIIIAYYFQRRGGTVYSIYTVSAMLQYSLRPLTLFSNFIHSSPALAATLWHKGQLCLHTRARRSKLLIPAARVESAQFST